MKYRVLVSPRASDAILAQAAYILEATGSPTRTADWLDRIERAFSSLDEFPRRAARAIEATDDLDIRAHNIDGFLLLYVIDEQRRTVTIVSARHGRQQPNDVGPHPDPNPTPNPTPSPDPAPD